MPTVQVFERLHSLLFAFGLVILISACGEKLSTDELLQRAQSALDSGEWNLAEINVKNALRQSPADALGRRIYGEILLQQRELPKAAEEFSRSLEASFEPDVALLYAATLADSGQHAQLFELHSQSYFDLVAASPRFLAALARAQAFDGDLFAAAETVREAEAIDAAAPDVRIAKALVVARHEGDLTAAAAILRGLVIDAPGNADAWSLLGSILSAHGKLSEAAEAFARAGEINGFRLPDQLNHMQLLIELKKFDEARPVVAQLSDRLPKQPVVNHAQAQLAMVDGDTGRALEELDEVFSVSPQHTQSLYLAANANLRRGSLSTAQNQIESFLAARPGNVNGLLILGAIHLQRGATEAALQIARQVLAILPDNDTAKLMYARALAENGSYESSAGAYEDLVGTEGSSAPLHAEYGDILLRAGKEKLGAIEYQQAVEQEPRNADLLVRLVDAHLRAGNNDAANETIAEFRAEFPDSPEPDLLLASVAMRARDLVTAREHLSDALELEPDSAAARRGLAGLALLENDTDAAASALNSELDAEKPDLQNLINLAALEERRGDTDAMERALRRAVEAYPNELTPRLLLARVAVRSGRPGEAVDLLASVRDQHTENPQVQEVLVYAFLALEQPGAAANAASAFVRLMPQNADAARLAARAELANDSLVGAAKMLREAVRLDQDDIETRALQLEVLVLQGDLAGVTEALAQLPKFFSDADLITFARNSVALKLVDADEAETLLRRAHQRKPNSASLLLLSLELTRNQKSVEALSYLDAWLENYPEDGVILNQVASLRAMRGEEDLAADAYERFIKLYPDDPIALNNLAWSLRATDTERALELVRAAQLQSPGNVVMIDTEAMVLMHAGDFDAALEKLDMVARRIGETGSIAFHRAQVLLAAKRREEARKILESLVAGPAFAEQGEAKSLLESL